MILVIIPDVDGDSLSIIDEAFPPEGYINVSDTETLKKFYDMDDILKMLASFNK